MSDNDQRFFLLFTYQNKNEFENSGSQVIFAETMEQAADRIMRERDVSNLFVKRRYHANGRVDEINRKFTRPASNRVEAADAQE